jgi:hypothetical protein
MFIDYWMTPKGPMEKLTMSINRTIDIQYLELKLKKNIFLEKYFL